MKEEWHVWTLERQFIELEREAGRKLPESIRRKQRKEAEERVLIKRWNEDPFYRFQCLTGALGTGMTRSINAKIHK
jgi:hypothetical protein